MPVWPSRMLYDSEKMMEMPIRLKVVSEVPEPKICGSTRSTIAAATHNP